MKNKIIFAISIVGSFFVGSALMFVLISYFPLRTEMIEKTLNEYKIEETAMEESIDKIYDAVVVVESFRGDRKIGTGTGFVYKKDSKFGYIITNAHVVGEGDKMDVIFSNEKTVTAELLGKDSFADIAVLSVPVEEIILVAEIGDSRESKLGSTVFTVGAPMGSDYSGTVTKGIVSGKDRIVTLSLSGRGSNDWIMKVIQTDAAINPGNSGGPLLNLAGQVIGINSLKIAVDQVEGMGFAIPIEDAMTYVEELEQGKNISRPLLGVDLIDLDEVYALFMHGIIVDSTIEHGVVVADVGSGTPAEKADIKKGDVILSVNKENVKNKAELRYELYKNKVGDTITIAVFRDKKIKEVEVVLADSNS